ncbi:MAG: FmdE family protein [Polyangiaceae bacterium]
MRLLKTWLLFSTALFLGCGAPTTAHDAPNDVDAKLAEVARIHGGAGPWAVAGYRMGEHALHLLNVERGSFDLEIVHFTPNEVQYSCIADGAAAATGASLGKLNLTLAAATAAETRTTYRRKSTGQTVTLRVTAAFAARFVNVPRERLGEAGREVIQLRDEEIFEVMP